MSEQKSNQEKGAHSSKKTPRGSKSVHSEHDNSTEDGYKPKSHLNREEE
ncbi:hypothetical protein [Rasiella sp. SM2506]